MGRHTLVRSSIIVTLAAVITLGLFFFMTELLGEKPTPPPTVTTGPININGFNDDIETPIDKVRPKLEPKKPMPPLEKKPFAGEDPITPRPVLPEKGKGINLPEIPKSAGNEFMLTNANKSATPMVQTQPQYPVDAARDGKEGWVVVRYDIDNNGKVINAEVIDADPKRTFNKAALRAVKNWKYKPKVEQGITVAQHNQQVQLDFKLDN